MSGFQASILRKLFARQLNEQNFQFVLTVTDLRLWFPPEMEHLENGRPFSNQGISIGLEKGAILPKILGKSGNFYTLNISV